MMKLFLGLALTCALAFAQGPGMGPGMAPGMGPGMVDREPGPANFDLLKAYLTLTDDQVTKLQAIQTAERQANRDRHQQIQDRETALHTALQQASPNPTELGQILLDIKNLRSQVQTNRGTYHTQALAVLTDAQKTKLAQLQAAADLRPTIMQAAVLNLLNPPADGPGMGMRGAGFGAGMFGPAMFGRGVVGGVPARLRGGR